MAKEIERKFLIDKELFDNCAYAQCHTAVVRGITQGYLFDIKNHVGRIRLTSDRKAVVTYKGPNRGITRTEVEFGVPYLIGKFLSNFCGPLIHKTRRTFPTIETVHGHGNTKWEVDTFQNLSEELILAEIELPSEGTEFSRPDWLGEEVSEDPAYYNSVLIHKVV